MTKHGSDYESPGWRRMSTRLGSARMEEMRLKTLREQAEALERAGQMSVADPATDRETYQGYPAPRLRGRRPRKKNA